MLKKIKSALGRNLNNIKGWNTNKKIIVIESDDWGSIRMPNSSVYNLFLEKGYPLASRPFETYDTLANKEDLDTLFQTLRGIHNKEGKNPIITANTVVANPDFEKILSHNFSEYFYEPFTKTLEQYYPEEDVFGTWKQGIKENLFFPQFHAREHYNTIKWMKALGSKDHDSLEAFHYKMVGIPSKRQPELGNQLQIALSVETPDDIDLQKEILAEGLKLFKEIFAYESKSFIAPVYTWSSSLNETLAQNNVRYLQGGKFQKSPNSDGTITNYKHYLGEKNTLQQYHLVRNVYFEPATNKNKDWLGDCFKDIEAAFFWNKPAIISTHRLNYIGSLNEENRKRGNDLLAKLLVKVVEKYPEVHFMTSVELGELIENN